MMNLQVRPIITAFERPPDEGKGLARDMRVSWAFDEFGQRHPAQVGPVGLLEDCPNFLALPARSEERPAFKLTFNTQLAFFNTASTARKSPHPSARRSQ